MAQVRIAGVDAASDAARVRIGGVSAASSDGAQVRFAGLLALTTDEVAQVRISTVTATATSGSIWYLRTLSGWDHPLSITEM